MNENEKIQQSKIFEYFAAYEALCYELVLWNLAEPDEVNSISAWRKKLREIIAVEIDVDRYFKSQKKQDQEYIDFCTKTEGN